MTSYQKRQARNAYSVYNSDRSKRFDECYVRPSYAKQSIFDSIYNDSKKLNGSFPLVMSYNTFMFTCGFEYPDPETGVLMFRYYTPSYTVDIEV